MRQYLNPFSLGITSGVLLSKNWSTLRRLGGPAAARARAAGGDLADKIRPAVSRKLDGLNAEISADLPPADGSPEATRAQAGHLLSHLLLGAGVAGGSLIYARYGPEKHRKAIGASAGMLVGQQLGALAGLLGAGPAGMLIGSMTGGVAGTVVGTEVADSHKSTEGTSK